MNRYLDTGKPIDWKQFCETFIVFLLVYGFVEGITHSGVISIWAGAIVAIYFENNFTIVRKKKQ